MIQVTPHMRVLVSVEPVDFRRGIDGLAQLCREMLGADPFSGTVFVFRNRRRTAIRLLLYDGQGYWLCYKRWSAGKLAWWPSAQDGAGRALRAHELQVLVNGGDPSWTRAPEVWRAVDGSR
jgi:transposase